MNSITACDLAQKLTANNGSIVGGRSGENQNLFILDCRPSTAFENLHIMTSVNLTFPSILYKRLLKGTLSPQSIIPSSSITVRNRFAENYKRSSIVLVDDNDGDCGRRRRKSTDDETIDVGKRSPDCRAHNWMPTASTLLYEKLRNESCDVYFVEGGIASFAESYPNLCQSSTQAEHFHLRIPSGDDQPDKIERGSIDEQNHQQNSSSSHTPCLGMKNLHLVDNRLPDSVGSLSSSENVRSVIGSCYSRSTTSNDSVYSDADNINLPGSLSSSMDAIEDYSEESSSKNSKSDRELHISAKEQQEMDVNDENDQKNGHCRPLDSRFPVEIISNLFLGNSSNSADKETLLKCNIKYILNVTPDLPNVFENDPDFRYLKLPIYDHWSQDLLIHFPAAISFIDEARQKNCGVLVHCLAGISRSVTVTVAYLMRTLSLSLEDAYDLVKDHKPNIAPNLNFMGQLLHFQRDLYGENVPFNRRKRGSDQWPADDYKQSNEPYIFTPLSAPPQRREGRSGAKNFAECF